MGGSGTPSSRSSPDDIRRNVEEAFFGERSETYEAEVSSLLNNELSAYNARNAQSLSAELQDILDALHEDDEGTYRLYFGGSIAKHTYVNGLSDADLLLSLERGDLADSSPQEAQQIVADVLSDLYGKGNVSIGNLAVTVKGDELHIQIIPAIRTATGFRIPEPTGNAWSRVVKPQAFAQKLTAENQRLGSKLVPAIKVVKSIISTLPEPQRPSGYHVESLAIGAMRGYSPDRITTLELVRQFFRKAPTLTLQPIADSSGQSIHVDDYLGKARSSERRIVSGALDRIKRQIENADRAQSLSMWENILGDI